LADFITFTLQKTAMSYPYQIKSSEDYKEQYQKSIENPEAFWAAVADNFVWRKNGIKCLNGTLKNQK